MRIRIWQMVVFHLDAHVHAHPIILSMQCACAKIVKVMDRTNQLLAKSE